APLAALAFKVVFDEHGQMTFVRVYSGTLEKGMYVLAPRSGKKVRVGRIVQLVAEKRIEVDALGAGEIGAVIGLAVAGGETLCSPDAPIVLETIRAPEPVMRIALEAKTADGRDKLGIALGRMVAADPSLRLETSAETGQTLLAGMGQLHLEIAVERLLSEHRVAVATGEPLVAYRSTLRRAVRTTYRHVKQTGGPGQRADVTIELAPGEPGSGITFEDRIKGGALTREYIRGVESGIREAAERGLFGGGYPVVDVRATLLDGAMHSNDSSELAFHIAGTLAFRQAADEAAPCVLEPVMSLEVVCPEEHVGTVVGDVLRRGGKMHGIDVRGDDRAVRAEVPLAESFGYANALSAMTHGRGRFTLEPSRYEQVPEGRARALMM
ncbi:MAG: elongation factor G, partial [Deltaproteobacteria bacterium]|nr:elongation factor G [Deltaproteobacteria bacterium]